MPVNKNSVTNIAGYKFEQIKNAVDLISVYQQKCEELGLKGTMLISKNGINFSLAGTQQATEEIIAFLEEDSRFLNIPLKVTYSETQPFRRMKVRLKKEIISLGRDDIDPRELTGEYVTPQELLSIYENNEDVVVLDTRNEYETRVGIFENAVDLQLDTFRDFPKAIEQLPEGYKDKQIVMYCTGGIRCETASAVLRSRGVKGHVVQLSGGIHRYLESFPGSKSLYLGKNFVFDARRTDGLIGKGSVGRCDRCGVQHDEYFDETQSKERICCHICKVLVLICPSCENSKMPFYCDEHAVWRSASTEWVEKRISSLHVELKRLQKTLKKDRERSIKSVHKDLEYCEAWLRNYSS